jgi:hypothetical protein
MTTAAIIEDCALDEKVWSGHETNASRVVRGGGETRRKTLIAFAVSFIVAFMLVQPVSAGTMIVVSDREGDLMKSCYTDTGEPKNGWGDNAPLVKAGYFDMVSMWLGQKGKTYTFGMKLAADLPKEGSPLPPGISAAAWILWIEPEAWTPTNPVASAFIVYLFYDGLAYSADLLDVVPDVTTAVPFTVDGSIINLEFSAASIGNPSSFWWSGGLNVFWGLGGWALVDITDPGAAPGQVYWDIPWPPL